MAHELVEYPIDESTRQLNHMQLNQQRPSELSDNNKSPQLLITDSNQPYNDDDEDSQADDELQDGDLPLNDDQISPHGGLQESKKDGYFSSSSTSSSYFESSSSCGEYNDDQPMLVDIRDMVAIGGSNVMPMVLSNQNDIEKELLHKNSQGLCRQEFGGTVIYDSCARIIGNPILQQYYEQNPPKQIDFNILFPQKEIDETDALFKQEARERDFQNDFDKFLYKHLPKFHPERDFEDPQYTINVPQQENILIFDSRFENGNLRRAIKVNNIEYNLWLENDLNTKGHTQWFFFKVTYRYPKKQKIQFNILNLMKPQSLYQIGMKPLIFSRNLFTKTGQGWHRGCDDIKYFQNEIPRKTNNSSATYNRGNTSVLYNQNGAGEGLEFHFTLSFWYEFEAEEEDEVYFAHAVPYTYTDLQQDIQGWITQDQKQVRPSIKANILCKTLGTTPCPLITITENVDTYLDYYDELKIQMKLPNLLKKQLKQKYQKCKKLYKQSLESRGKVRRLLKAAFDEEINSFYEFNEEQFNQADQCFNNFHNKLKPYIMDHSHKKAIIITSRVHPGEPQSSHMLKGAIEYLLSDKAHALRQHFVFRIVPMLNVDGVIYGNYRCSLLGVDLNRKWSMPNKFLHPPVYYAKQLVKNMHHERRVLIYTDLHGHSRKQNAFFYGCTYKNFEHEGRIKNAQLRILPLLCCHKNPIYSFKDCRFRVEKCKESTARVVVFREFNIMNSFTLESSFFGKEIEPTNGSPSQFQTESEKKVVQHLLIDDYLTIGEQLIVSMHNYLPQESNKLNMLSGKILEIFHDEFIKFIPPYVLKREEEKKKQLEQQNTMKRNSSPKQQQQQQMLVNLQIKKIRKIKHQAIDKSKIKRKKTFGVNNNNINNISKKDYKNNISCEQIKEPFTVPEKQSSDVEENFSEMIHIQSCQDDILDLEFFIQKEQSKIKHLEDKKELKKLGSLLSDEDDEGAVDMTDSSDSESSVKKIFSKQQEEAAANVKNKNKKKIVKAAQHINKKGENIQSSQQKTTDKQQVNQIESRSFTKQQRNTQIAQNQNSQLTSFDQLRYGKFLNDQSDTFRDQLRSKDNRKSLLFDKIPHRKGSSISSSEEDREEAKLVNTRNIPVKSEIKLYQDDEMSTPIAKVDMRNSNKLADNNMFQSFEEVVAKAIQNKKPIIPLYENAQYHQKRLQNSVISDKISQKIPLSGVYQNNAALNRNQNDNLEDSTSPEKSSPSHIRPNTTHEVAKNAQILMAHDVEKKIIRPTRVNPYLPQDAITIQAQLFQPFAQPQGNRSTIRQQIYQYDDTYKNTSNSYNHHNPAVISSKYNSIIPPPTSTIGNAQCDDSQSFQRVSFKELLESSRQNRGNSNEKQRNSSHAQPVHRSSLLVVAQQQPNGSNHLLNMLKSTYQKFQQAQGMLTQQQNQQQQQQHQQLNAQQDQPRSHQATNLKNISTERRMNLIGGSISNTTAGNVPSQKTPVNIKKNTTIGSSHNSTQKINQNSSSQVTSRDHVQFQQLNNSEQQQQQQQSNNPITSPNQFTIPSSINLVATPALARDTLPKSNKFHGSMNNAELSAYKKLKQMQMKVNQQVKQEVAIMQSQYTNNDQSAIIGNDSTRFFKKRKNLNSQGKSKDHDTTEGKIQNKKKKALIQK